ncbi:hypothetical protein [Kushneria sp. TE3]|uniref:hypothetical protein n=1 Tax=Kushneria sp. TE3 TaxID=3449832 RepID=UPI003F6889FF
MFSVYPGDPRQRHLTALAAAMKENGSEHPGSLPSAGGRAPPWLSDVEDLRPR